MASWGGEFITAVAELDLARYKCPYVAFALIFANQLSPKVTDGVCKCPPISKVKHLKAKEMLHVVLKADRLLEQGRDSGKKLGLENDASYVKAMGHLWVRTAAFLTDQKQVWEAAVFDSLEAIAQD